MNVLPNPPEKEASGYVRGFSQALTLFEHLVSRGISPQDALAHCRALLDEDIHAWAAAKTAPTPPLSH